MPTTESSREAAAGTADQAANEPLLNQKGRPHEVRKKGDERDLKMEGSPTATMVVPPDGGWGWVVVAASFCCNMLVDGIIFNYGCLLPHVMDETGASRPSAALVGSLLSGFYLIAGPFVSGLANRYGFRLVTITGSLITAASFTVASFAVSNITALHFVYGVLGGIGFGMIYAPSVIIVGFYFERWRALATGIAICGSGIGTFMFSPVLHSIAKEHGLRATILVQAALVLGGALCGLLFRPLKPVQITVEPQPEEENLLVKMKRARDEHMKRTVSLASIVEDKGPQKANNNREYPTAAEMLNLSPERPDSAATDTTRLSKSTQSLSNMIIGHNEEVDAKRKRLSAPSFPDKQINDAGFSREGREASRSENTVTARDKRRLSESSRRGTVTEYTVCSRRATITQLDDSTNRPMYRDDIFLNANLNRLPQYKSEKDIMSYTISVTRLPTKRDLAEESRCICCPEAVRRTMATMMDLSLFKSPTFNLYCISGATTLMGFLIPFMFISRRAEVGGFDANLSMWLVSTIGIANTVGRVLTGLISSIPCVDVLVLNNIALTVGGVATIVSGYSLSTGFQLAYSILFGLSVACFASLRSILIVDLLGLDKLTNAFGLSLLFQGIAMAIGAPLAGLLEAATNSLDAPFYFSGTLMLLSGVMCYPLRAVNKWERKNEARASQSRVV